MLDIGQIADAVADRVVERLTARAARRFVSIREYSESASISERTVHRAIAEGRLPVERVGRRVLIPADARIQPQ